MFIDFIDPNSGKTLIKDDQLTYTFNKKIREDHFFTCKDGSLVDYQCDYLLSNKEEGICYTVKRGIAILLEGKQIEIGQIIS